MFETTQIGHVDRWSNLKGFGFICNHRDDSLIFVHYSGILGKGIKNLYPGEDVKFLIGEDERGKYAYNVQRMRNWRE